MEGMLTLQNMMNGLISGKVQSNEGVGKCIVRIYPKVYKSMNLGVVSRILEKESYVLILDVQSNSCFFYILSGPRDRSKILNAVFTIMFVQYNTIILYSNLVLNLSRFFCSQGETVHDCFTLAQNSIVGIHSHILR